MKLLYYLLTVFLFSGCIIIEQSIPISGNGNVISKSMQTTPYQVIEVGGIFHVTLVDGIPGEIEITGDENLLEYVSVEVQDERLVIRTKDNLNLKPSQGNKIELFVPVQNVSGLSVSGSGKMFKANDLIANNLDLSISGSGKMELAIQTNHLTLSVSGSGSMELNGSAEEISASVSGSGNVNAQDVLANLVTARISGSGNMKIYCSERLDATISGSGKILYTGNPFEVHSNISGSGKLKEINN